MLWLWYSRRSAAHCKRSTCESNSARCSCIHTAYALHTECVCV